MTILNDCVQYAIHVGPYKGSLTSAMFPFPALLGLSEDSAGVFVFYLLE